MLCRVGRGARWLGLYLLIHVLDVIGGMLNGVLNAGAPIDRFILGDDRKLGG